MDILEQLNESQKAAVEYCDGAQLVIAGAGSGKTRVLTYKIAYLLSLGMKPWNILALTFTNKAANEMKERIGSLVGHDLAMRLNMGTFHSVFARILRTEAEHIGYKPNFTIYDQADSRSLIKAIVKEMNLDEKVYKPAAVGERISMAKNRLVGAAQYASNPSILKIDTDRKMPAIKDVYVRYCERCRQANAMDFDDLLMNIYLLFAGNEEIRKKYSDRFDYVLVDEYQDTNSAQQAILLQITKEKQKVCVVGDDAQSIYSFRGANIDNILGFQRDYKDAKLFKLEQNYRSTQTIVEAANSLIRHNVRQIPKNVFSENEQGEKLILKPAYSDKEEAMIVCNDIKKIKRKDKCEYSDFAILYRTNSQSRSFEEYMRKQNIPYKIYGGLSFYQRKEIKDIIAYFRLVANPDDEEALKRIINYPARGIGNTTVGKIVSTANSQNVSLWSVINNPTLYGLDVSKATVTKLTTFRTMVESWMEQLVTADAYSLGKTIITESGVFKDVQSGREPEDIARRENVDEFFAGLSDFVAGRQEEDQGNHVSLSDFLQEVSLLTDLESEGDDNEQKVVLMTVHSAKGLEFKTVFIVGLEENIFPSPMCVDSPRALEEERRLLYVAITRAEKHCILTHAQNRFRYGKMDYDTPSRFIRDIDPRLIKVEGGTSSDNDYRTGGYDDDYRTSTIRTATPRQERKSPRLFTPSGSYETPSVNYQKASPLNSQETPVSSFERASKIDIPTMAVSSSSEFGLAVGNVIEHQRFGIGAVLKIEGTGENTKATVEFRNTGTKQLLLKFAKYKVIK